MKSSKVERWGEVTEKVTLPQQKTFWNDTV